MPRTAKAATTAKITSAHEGMRAGGDPGRERSLRSSARRTPTSMMPATAAQIGR